MVAQLLDRWARELLISSFYLFGHGACHLDGSRLARELRGGTAAGAAPGGLTNQRIDAFFQEHVTPFPPFNALATKIPRLDTPEGQTQFLQLLQDDRLMQKLKLTGDDRALVFRFHQGKLQAKRRGITPDEYKFY